MLPSLDSAGIRSFAYALLRHAFSEFGLTIDALGELITGFAVSFNAAHPDVPHVRYFSYAGAQADSIALKGAHLYIETIGQSDDARTNDGIVTIEFGALGPAFRAAVGHGQFRRDRLQLELADAAQRVRPSVRVPQDRLVSLRVARRQKHAVAKEGPDGASGLW